MVGFRSVHGGQSGRVAVTAVLLVWAGGIFGIPIAQVIVEALDNEPKEAKENDDWTTNQENDHLIMTHKKIAMTVQCGDILHIHKYRA